MTTELVLSRGTANWKAVAGSLEESLLDLVCGGTSTVVVATPNGGPRIDAYRLPDGSLRLAAAGNDSLIGGDRLTVREERAVLAVGFSVSSASWGSFYWDWSAPVVVSHVASGIIRTMRDIYKAPPEELELTVTL